MIFTSRGNPTVVGSPADLESKEIGTNIHIHAPDGGTRIVDSQEENNLSRSLTQRHIQMIALAGAIVNSPPPNLLDAHSTNKTRVPDYSSLSAAPSKPAVLSARSSAMHSSASSSVPYNLLWAKSLPSFP